MSSADRVEPIWLDARDANAIRERQLAEHGGGQGVRDQGLLESALTRAKNRWAYGDDDPAILAAAYAFGIARSHPFVDGNKRTAWVIARLFLVLNGHQLAFTPAEAIAFMQALAPGELSEEQVADWFRERIVVG
jgi:death on curing protein